MSMNNNFSIKENGIIINYSDATNIKINYPNDKVKISKDGSKHIKIDHITIDHYKIQTKWLKPLGIAIANYLRQKYNTLITEDQEYLLNFPSGYEFYDFITYNDSELKTKVRTDNYLFGKYRFRSTNEFTPHLIWIVSDKSEDCKCCYCPMNSRTAKKKRELEISTSTSLNLTKNNIKKQKIIKSFSTLLSISTLSNQSFLNNKSLFINKSLPTISFNSNFTHNTSLTKNNFSSLTPPYKDESSLQKVSFYSPNNPQISKISYYSLNNNNNNSSSSQVRQSDSFDQLCKAQYRINEVVWICLLSDDSMETFENVNKVITNHNARIPYWPALITNSTFNNTISKFVYTVKFIYIVVEEINVLEDYISPLSFSLVDITNKILSRQVKVICHSHYRYLEVILCITYLKKTYTLYSPSFYDAEKDLYHYNTILIGTEQINLGDIVKLISTTDLFIIKDIIGNSNMDNIRFIGYYILDDSDHKYNNPQVSITLNQIGGKNYTRFPSIQHDEISRHRIDINDRENLFSVKSNDYFKGILHKELNIEII